MTAARFLSAPDAMQADYSPTGQISVPNDSGVAQPGSQLWHPLVVGLSAVLMISVVGLALVMAAKKFNFGMLRASGSTPVFRVLASRRLNARLQVVALELEHGRTIVIADNGQAITVVAEYPSQRLPSSGKPDDPV